MTIEEISNKVSQLISLFSKIETEYPETRWLLPLYYELINIIGTKYELFTENPPEVFSRFGIEFDIGGDTTRAILKYLPKKIRLVIKDEEQRVWWNHI